MIMETTCTQFSRQRNAVICRTRRACCQVMLANKALRRTPKSPIRYSAELDKLGRCGTPQVIIPWALRGKVTAVHRADNWLEWRRVTVGAKP